jgi:putative aminopeptidase FrvX
MNKNKRYSVPSLPEYDEIEFDVEKVLEARDKRLGRKMPTSVSLHPDVVEELKSLAEKKGIPYQVLMRSFIMEGLEKMKKESD